MISPHNTGPDRFKTPLEVDASNLGYCSTCGSRMAFTAPTCPQCGAPSRAGKATKSKTAAVLLAVFLSFWTWLYTYRTDRWKFWTGLGIAVGSYVFTATALVGAPPGPRPTFIEAFGWVLCVLGVWVWAIIDRSIKPSSHYGLRPRLRR
jgi:hypothetical protein